MFKASCEYLVLPLGIPTFPIGNERLEQRSGGSTEHLREFLETVYRNE